MHFLTYSILFCQTKLCQTKQFWLKKDFYSSKLSYFGFVKIRRLLRLNLTFNILYMEMTCTNAFLPSGVNGACVTIP